MALLAVDGHEQTKLLVGTPQVEPFRRHRDQQRHVRLLSAVALSLCAVILGIATFGQRSRNQEAAQDSWMFAPVNLLGRAAVHLSHNPAFSTKAELAQVIHDNQEAETLEAKEALERRKVLKTVTDVCKDAEKGDPCYYSVSWAMNTGIFQNPEWYKELDAGSSFGQFQLALYQDGVKNCTGYKPCHMQKLVEKQKEAEQSAEKANKVEAVAIPEAPKKVPPPGPRLQTFYMYRAQSEATYPLENINTADLAGVFWYLHNEVVVATPRKYRIDRIKRYKVTVRNTWEFWNAHKRQFGAFVAYDAGRCSTPVCEKIYHQYGFIVGCQVQPLSVASYLGRHQTNWQCKAGQDECRAPIWYSLPGACPAKGIPNDAINPNSVHLDVSKYKTPECVQRMPGGSCKSGHEATGDPTCTYSYEDAGEIFLDDLVGVGDYNTFWNTSFTECLEKRVEHVQCKHNKEYDPVEDEGVGTSFWNGKLDPDKCTERMDKARKLFKKKFPEFPEHLKEPPCEFDMYYDGEFDWDINHTGAAPSEWWKDRM